MSIARKLAQIRRRPHPGGLPHAGGDGRVYVHDERGFSVPLAEVYVVKVDRDDDSVLEHVTALRTNEGGDARFTLPAIAADEKLLYVVEKAGYERGSAIARPGLYTRIQIARTKRGQEFRPEPVVFQDRSQLMGQLPGQYIGTTFYAAGATLPSGQIATQGVLLPGQPVPYSPVTGPTMAPIPMGQAEIDQARSLGRAAAGAISNVDGSSYQRKNQLLSQIQNSFKHWMKPEDRNYIMSAASGNPPAAGASPETEYLQYPFHTNLYALVRNGAANAIVSAAALMAIRRGEVSNARQSANADFNIGVSEAMNQEGERSAAAQAAFTQYSTQFYKLPSQIATGSPFRPSAGPNYQATYDAFFGQLPKGVQGGWSPSSLLTNMTYPVRDRINTMMERRAQQVWDAAAPLRAVFDSIPWPHPFFRSFVTGYVRANPGVFYQNILIWDWEALMEAGYFQNSKERIERDVARWISDNGEQLKAHFIAEAENWAKEQEKKQRQKDQPFVILDIFLKIFGMASNILIPGLGAIVSSVLSGAWKVYRTTQVGEQQRDAMKRAMTVLSISDAAMQRFSDWIAAHITISVQAGYRVYVEGRLVGRAMTTEQAVELANQNSRPGDRIEILLDDTGGVIGRWLRTGTGTQQIPDDVWAQVKEMSHDTLVQRLETATKVTEAKVEAGKVAPPTGGGFPWWTIPLVFSIFGK